MEFGFHGRKYLPQARRITANGLIHRSKFGKERHGGRYKHLCSPVHFFLTALDRMDEASLILGITGTGGVVCAIVMYVLSKGLRSNCRALKMEVNLDIHQTDESGKEQPLSLTRSELEAIIVETVHKMPNPASISAGNIILPTIQMPERQPSLHELEEIIRDSIHKSSDRESLYTRSRSESEDSHRSHHSKGRAKEESSSIHIVV